MIRSTSMIALTTAAALALTLAACKKPAPEAQDSDVSNSLTQVPADIQADAPGPPVESVAVTPVPAKVAPPKPVAAPVERTVREEQQIEDDADAAGMTARLPADRDAQPADSQAEEAQAKQ